MGNASPRAGKFLRIIFHDYLPFVCIHRVICLLFATPNEGHYIIYFYIKASEPELEPELEPASSPASARFGIGLDRSVGPELT